MIHLDESSEYVGKYTRKCKWCYTCVSYRVYAQLRIIGDENVFFISLIMFNVRKGNKQINLPQFYFVYIPSHIAIIRTYMHTYLFTPHCTQCVLMFTECYTWQEMQLKRNILYIEFIFEQNSTH